jgi:Ni/Co efflux regulator RcnB
MRKAIIAALAVSTALGGSLSAGIAAAQPPGYYGDHDRGDRDRDHDRGNHHWRYYGGHYGYNGYRGHWRTGQRYPNWRDNRYAIEDWRAYNLPPPRPGYRYYRDDSGEIVMAAIASGVIGLIVGNAVASNNQPYYRP